MPAPDIRPLSGFLDAKAGGQVKQFGQLGRLPIGMFSDADYASEDCIIDRSGSLYIFSDGLYELEQRNGTLWDLEGLTTLLINRANSASANLDEIIQGVQTIQGRDSLAIDQDELSACAMNCFSARTGVAQ